LIDDDEDCTYGLFKEEHRLPSHYFILKAVELCKTNDIKIEQRIEESVFFDDENDGCHGSSAELSVVLSKL
jgi:hypothetical protein